ncbi:MAG: hypothetical protein FWD23_01455, partial [Oscillospiraceae bacterium]|nr:hypothetical protein [Oscillospiraceae bacterium]
MKNKKILTALTAAFLALAMVLIPGCGGFPGLDFDKLASGLEGLVSELGNMAEDWEKYASARENLTNFKIAIETTDENNNTSVLTEARTENGYALIAD